METKYIIFGLVMFLGVPAGLIGCFIFPALSRFFIILLIWATCEPNLVGINFVSREFYRANTRGFEVSLVDVCVLVLLGFMMLKRSHYPSFRWKPPLTFLILLYFLIGLISWSQAGTSLPVPEEAVRIPYMMFEVKLYPLFELLKILRGFLLYLVIVNYVRDEASARTVLTGISLTVFYMGYLALTSRYIHGVNRVQATLGHANSLATYMAMVGTFVYAFLLQSKSLTRSLWYGFLTLLSGISVILTIARGGLAAFALGIWLNTLFLFPRHFNLKNTFLLSLGAVAAAAVLLMAMDTLLNRFVGEQSASEDLAYRGLYNQEAILMSHDHFWGVGLGNFSAWSWYKYAEEVDPDLPPGTPAHNNWYLNRAEVGMIGMLALAAIWIRYFVLALPFYFKRRKDLLGTTAAAACSAVLVNHLQSCLQLGYRQTPLYFMMMIFTGLTVAVWFTQKQQTGKRAAL